MDKSQKQSKGIQSADAVLGSSNIILFFSLPFKPVGKRNYFYNGHIALGIGNMVYQVYNPQLLKSAFLYSIMPMHDWLFGAGGKWVERDETSLRFRHVYLYGKSESTRTVVYCAGINAAHEIVESMRNRFTEEDARFRAGNDTYDFFRNNCSSRIANGLISVGLANKSLFNLIPSLFFKRFVSANRKNSKVHIAKINSYESASFALHRFCIGIPSTRPQTSMDKWVGIKS